MAARAGATGMAGAMIEGARCLDLLLRRLEGALRMLEGALRMLEGALGALGTGAGGLCSGEAMRGLTDASCDGALDAAALG